MKVPCKAIKTVSIPSHILPDRLTAMSSNEEHNEIIQLPIETFVTSQSTSLDLHHAITCSVFPMVPTGFKNVKISRHYF